MKILEIVTGYNRTGINPKTGRPWQDATGAFLPEEKAFRKLHGGGRLEFVTPSTPVKRRLATEAAIRGEPGLDVLAIFGHGTASSLIVSGHGLANVHGLAEVICATQEARLPYSVPALTVVLYACSTAAGKEGFADKLADLVPFANVWAHSKAGHSTWNPNTELAGGPNRGDPIARPGDPLWRKWRDRMAEDQSYRLSFWLPAHGLRRAEALEAVRASVSGGTK
jgi:hypothetical protein